MKNTPMVYARGRYEVASPWVLAQPVQDYTCYAVRSFTDLIELGIDPYDEYYAPMGVGRNRYEKDVANAASIVTLISEDGRYTIYIPDTFITSYPDMNSVPYSDMVLQVIIRKIPEDFDLEYIGADIKELVDAKVGSPENNTVAVTKFPVTERISLQSAEALETARLSSITDVDNWYAKYQRQLKLIENLEATNAALIAALEENGWTG